MSQSKAAAGNSVASKLGFHDGELVQEIGYDDDVDFDFRDQVEELIGSEMLDEEDQDIVDGILLWWRDGDGDLVDVLVDLQAFLSEGAPIWLLTPKPGREGHVSPSDIQEAVPPRGCTQPPAQDFLRIGLLPA